ncbi:MAG: hypothetical protein DRH49_04020 [Candidatus Coatesbacteria bacterium]|nr:MAG: hypothetical protein DRH49_04020 [Candidatus Coatesbacteria bacterium]
MRYLTIFIMVLMVSPIMAKEIELLPGVYSEPTEVTTSDSFSAITFLFPEEQELFNDDGSVQSAHYGLLGQATTFEAPCDCHLVRLKYLLDGSNFTWYFDVYHTSSGNKPDHNNPYFDEPIEHYGSHSQEWVETDVTDKGVVFSEGEVFHPYYEYAGGHGNSDGANDAPEYSNWWRFNSENWSEYSYYFGSAMLRVFINDDMDPPYADGFDPADGDTVPPDTNIVFHAKDDDVGVDSDTINTDSVVVTVGGEPVPGSLDVSGDESDYTVTFDPDSDFTQGDTVIVTLSPEGNEITDLLGNPMETVEYSFNIGSYAVIVNSSIGVIKAEYK